MNIKLYIIMFFLPFNLFSQIDISELQGEWKPDFTSQKNEMNYFSCTPIEITNNGQILWIEQFLKPYFFTLPKGTVCLKDSIIKVEQIGGNAVVEKLINWFKIISISDSNFVIKEIKNEYYYGTELSDSVVRNNLITFKKELFMNGQPSILPTDLIGKYLIGNKLKKGELKKDSGVKLLENGITTIKINDKQYKEDKWSILPNNRIMINGRIYIIKEISNDEITLYPNLPLSKSDFKE